MVIDPSISNSFVFSAWLSYGGRIRSDMESYYKNNPNGDYIIPYTTEIDARNALIDFYLLLRNDLQISDKYLEDLIKIRTSNLLKEYVFFSFNPGCWKSEENFLEENYREWMQKNMPDHVPLTLAYVEKDYLL